MKDIILLILIGIAAFYTLIFTIAILRKLKKPFFIKWIHHSLTAFSCEKEMHKHLRKMNDNNKTLFLTGLLSLDHEYYWRYWFGRRLKRIIISELNKLS